MKLPDTEAERAVSPVIGVILMVAITVILAAVIGAFVFELGGQLGSTGPQTQLSVSDASAAYADGADAIEIAHKGGDELTVGEIKIVVKNAETSSVVNTYSGGSWSSTGLNLSLNGGTVSSSSEFTVGDTLTISDDGSVTGTALSSGTEYRIEVIHTPSDSIITSNTVELT